MGNILGVPSTWGRSNKRQKPAKNRAQVPMNPQQNPSESSENLIEAQSSALEDIRNRVFPRPNSIRVFHAYAVNPAERKSAAATASTLALATLSEEERQKCSGLRTVNSLSTRISTLRELASNVVACLLSTHRVVWLLVDDLASKDARTESRDICFRYFAAVAALPGLTSVDVDDLSDLIRIPVAAPLVSKQVAALESLLNLGEHIETLRSGFNTFILRTLKPQYTFVVESRRVLKGFHGQRSEANMAEVHGLYKLLAFFLRIVSGGLPFIIEGMIPDFVSELLLVANSTASRKDLSRLLPILLILIELGKVPATHWKDCMMTLCGTLCLKEDIQTIAQKCLMTLCRTGSDDYVVEILVEIINEVPPDGEQRRVRGALRMLMILFTNNDHKNYPAVSFHELVRCVGKVFLVCARYQEDSLKIMQTLLCDDNIRDRILGEDWSILFKILTETITTLPRDLIYGGKRGSPHGSVASTLHSPHSSVASSLQSAAHNTPDEWKTYREQQSRTIANSLELIYPQVRLDKQELICVFFLKAAMPPLPEAIIEDLIDTLLSHFPLAASHNRPRMFMNLLPDNTLDPEKRALILERLREAIPESPGTAQLDQLRRLVSELMSRLPQEQNVRLVNAIAALLTTYARVAELKEIDNIVQTLIAFVDLEGTSGAVWHSTKVDQPSNTVTSSLIGLFLYYMNRSAEKAVLIYDALVGLIDNTEHSPSSARLAAMKLATRLRCTASSSVSPATAGISSRLTSSGASESSHAIMVVAVPDSLGLAAFLCRTEDSAASIMFNLNNVDFESAIEQTQSRAGRSSTISSPGTSRPKTRSTSGQGRGLRPTPPLWMYPGRKGLPEDPPKTPSRLLRLYTSGSDPKTTLRVDTWLETMTKILEAPKDWEMYSYTLVHLPSQLSNSMLFSGSIPQIQQLLEVIVKQLWSGTFTEPPVESGAKKGDVALCLVHSLIMLIAYSEHFSTNEQDAIVGCLYHSQGQFDRVAKTCIQALTVCCYELPRAIAGSLDPILEKMAQMITTAPLAMDILEFLGALATIPNVHASLPPDGVDKIFLICVRHLEHSREQREKLKRASAPGTSSHNPNRQSALSFGSASTHSIHVHKDLPQYIYALAYHVITFWFLSINLVNRPRYVRLITDSLSSMDARGNEIMEEQSQVTLDMMHRTTYLDLGETRADPQFTSSDGTVRTKSWIVGLSIVTIETAVGTGRTQITKRQASGTTYATYFQHTTPLPLHHAPMTPNTVSAYHDSDARVNILPNHVFMQLSSTIAPIPTPMEPICLPDDESIQRAISAFDRNDTVDGYKAGVIYVGNGQSSEAEILANTTHSPGFTALLEGLGTKVTLKGATFNTQGLDRQTNADGEFTYAWRNRVVEIVYHVPSMMPTDKHDPQGVLKKRHIGNDFVNIIYNESGLPFDFNTFASQFNYVNIVVTPDGLFAPEPKPDAQLETIVESSQSSSSSSTKSKRHSRHGSANTISPMKKATSDPKLTSTPTTLLPLPKTFKVQTLLHPSFPPLSPAHTCKSITRHSLAPFLRQMALNASVFSYAWSVREGGEHVSSWRNRLREIYRLRERYGPSGNVSAGVAEEAEAKGKKGIGRFSSLFGGGGGDKDGASRESQSQGVGAERIYVEGDKFMGQVRMGGLSEEEGVRVGLDFTRWAGEQPSSK